MVSKALERVGYYGAYTAFFATVYLGVLQKFGRFPEPLLFGLLALSVGKDVADEWRLARGETSLVPVTEHAPSNVVILVLLATGVVRPRGSFAGHSATRWAAALAFGDLVLDLSQDARG